MGLMLIVVLLLSGILLMGQHLRQLVHLTQVQLCIKLYSYNVKV